MKSDEILIELEELNIIMVVGEEYHVTEKYKQLLQNSNLEHNAKTPDKSKFIGKNKKTLKKSLKEKESKSFYPSEVSQQVDRAQSVAFLEFCEVPIYSKGPNVYRLRSLDGESIKIINNIVNNPTQFEPTIIVKVIKDYYSSIEMPKAFKNFAVEDLLDMYVEHLSGNAHTPNNSKDNSKWG